MDIRTVEYVAPSQVQLGMVVTYTFDDETHHAQTVTAIELLDNGSAIVEIANGLQFFVPFHSLIQIEV